MKNVDFLRHELSAFSQRAYHRRLVCGTGGNLSVRIPETDTVLITPTGISLGDVKPEENILINLKGEILDPPTGLKSSIETSLHLAAYQIRPDIGAIAHLHPPYATAYSNKGKALPLVTITSRIVLRQVPCLECFIPGSTELCNCVSEGIQKNPDINALLMKEHGILILGQDLKAVYHLADLVEETAQTAYIAFHINAF